MRIVPTLEVVEEVEDSPSGDSVCREAVAVYQLVLEGGEEALTRAIACFYDAGAAVSWLFGGETTIPAALIAIRLAHPVADRLRRRLGLLA